jgi:hypothetical protein
MEAPVQNLTVEDLMKAVTPSSYPAFPLIWQERVKELQAQKVPGEQWDAEYEALRERYRAAHPTQTFAPDYPPAP